MVDSEYFSVFDAGSGFNQLNMHKNSQEMTAFRIHNGLYEFLRLPFGIQSGPAVFQRIMNEVLAPWLWIFVLVYIDDIITYSKTFEEHLKHVDTVLQDVIKAG